MMACLSMVAMLITGCGKAPEQEKQADTPPTKPPVEESAEKRREKTDKAEKFISKNPSLDPQRLVGQWLRPDGGYVIKVTHVASDGKVEASYHNPRPIRVESASASNDTGKLMLRVKLNDRGYPGCIYELEYDRENDVLVGTYFQAAMQQTYRIGFQRLQ